MWEYEMFCTTINDKGVMSNNVSGKNLYRVWKKTNNPIIDVDGGTPLDYINKLGQEGWELVKVTPLIIGTISYEILFTFRRPITQE